MNPKLSIIVPVYNAQVTLRRCVDSILNQHFTDFELLLADDGSTDGSGAICDAYQRQDTRVRVIHKQNTGVSDTRNRAMDHAKGRYLQFLDSDDWITAEASELMVGAAERYSCDLVIADFYRVIGERVSHKGDIEEDGVLSREDFAARMMKNPADFYYGVLWNKLFRRELVERYHLRMNTQISWCEDFMFNLEYIRHAERFYALQVPVYYYVKTKGSLASQGLNPVKVIRMKRMVFEYYNRFFRSVLDEEDYEKSRLQIYAFLIDASGDGSVLPGIFPGASRRLGDERMSVSGETLEGTGILSEIYRERKLLERCLEVPAIRSNLREQEIALFFCLAQRQRYKSRSELADILGITRSRLNLALQKLAARELIAVQETRPQLIELKIGGEKAQTKKRGAEAEAVEPEVRTKTDGSLEISFLPRAEKVLEEMARVQNSCDSIRFAGFTEDELMQYAVLSDKIKQNIRRAVGGSAAMG